mgnify:CR=1 FL=1
MKKPILQAARAILKFLDFCEARPTLKNPLNCLVALGHPTGSLHFLPGGGGEQQRV